MKFSAATWGKERPPGAECKTSELASCSGEPGKSPSIWHHFSFGDAAQALECVLRPYLKEQKLEIVSIARGPVSGLWHVHILCATNSSEDGRTGATCTSIHTKWWAHRAGYGKKQSVTSVCRWEACIYILYVVVATWLRVKSCIGMTVNLGWTAVDF